MEVIRDSITDRIEGCYYLDAFHVIVCISFIPHSCWTLHEPRAASVHASSTYWSIQQFCGHA